jgi:hypothetical protein
VREAAPRREREREREREQSQQKSCPTTKREVLYAL